MISPTNRHDRMHQLRYKIGKTPEKECLDLDFWDGLSRSTEERIDLGLLPVKLPVIDDAPYRIFETMKEYSKWAEKTLPRYLGYYHNDD